MKSILTIFFASLLLISCSITKRRYTEGYSIQWKKSLQSDAEIRTDEIQKNFSSGEIEKSDESLNSIVSEENCDTLFLKDGTFILVKVYNIKSDVIEYQNCLDESTELLEIKKSDVGLIKYPTGKEHSFESKTEKIDREIKSKNQNLTGDKGDESKKETSKRRKKDEGEIERLGLVLFIALLVLLAIFGIFLFLAATTFSDAAMAIYVLSLIGMIILSIIGFFGSLISIYRTLTNKEEYRLSGIVFAILAFAISVGFISGLFYFL